MKIEYSGTINNTEIEAINNSFKVYRQHVKQVITEPDFSQNESSLATATDGLMKEGVKRVVSEIGEVSHVILIGIGGSSLGTEAIYSALKTDNTPELHTLDSIAPQQIKSLVESLKNIPKEKIAICAISKSGGTTETLSNTSILLNELATIYGEQPYDRLICIGNPDNPLLQAGEKVGAKTLAMHAVVGGRYSVFTAVGLVPLSLLGFDIDEILRGVSKASNEENEKQVADGAIHLFGELNNGVRSVNFFTFDAELEKLGYWYRQLTAESLGKEKDIDGNSVNIGFIPTISTPVELHSIGQLYFSGFKGVFTDFVRFDIRKIDYTVQTDSIIAEKFQGKTMREIHEAIYGGVIGAYKERALAHKITTLSAESAYDLGLFMGMRMLETMYLANLMHVNAFNQPNVELYKNITRDILEV